MKIGEANKITAEMCDILNCKNPYDDLDSNLYYRPDWLPKNQQGEVWTIEDARCMEIIEEKMFHEVKYYKSFSGITRLTVYVNKFIGSSPYEESGTSIKEVKITVVIAICEKYKETKAAGLA